VDGFTVPVEAVRSAAEAADRVLAAVAPVDLSGPLRALAAGMPRSRAAEAALGPAGEWAAELNALAAQVRRHADAMVETARAYQETDAAFAARMPVPAAIAAVVAAGAQVVGAVVSAATGGSAAPLPHVDRRAG
jgi:hypothetical protein